MRAQPDTGATFRAQTSGLIVPSDEQRDPTEILDEVVGNIQIRVALLPPGTIVRRSLFDFHAYPPAT